MDILNKKIILASKSPRRHELMTRAGFSFEIKTREVNEDYPETLPTDEVAAYLANKKADACTDFLSNEEEILLTADSIVILDQKIYGKPVDFDDAFNILRELSGKTHRVITGVCLLSKNKKRVFSGISDVHLEEMTDDEIRFYINKYEPYDKAGAYAVQEWVGLCKISKIEGTYSNIMGLPMEDVYRELSAF